VHAGVQLDSTESRACRAGNAQPAAAYFGRVPKFPSNVTAQKLPASANAGDGGSRRSAEAMPTIAITMRGANARGVKRTPTTGGNTGKSTRSTPRATVCSSARVMPDALKP